MSIEQLVTNIARETVVVGGDIFDQAHVVFVSV